jgi:hypothetical protein
MSVTEIRSGDGSVNGEPPEDEDDLRSIEERAAAGEAEELGPEQMQFPGTEDRLTLSAGGAKPTSALAKIAAISLPMPPQQQMSGEQEVIVQVRCRVVMVGFRELEKGGKQREHTRKPIELISVEASDD